MSSKNKPLENVIYCLEDYLYDVQIKYKESNSEDMKEQYAKDILNCKRAITLIRSFINE